MTLFSMQLRATILVMVVVLIRSIFLYKLPKKIFLALWTLVLARLYIPFFGYITLHSSIPSTDILWITWLRIIERSPRVAATDTATMTSYCAPWVYDWIWLAGCLSLAVYFIAGHVRGRMIYRFAYPVESDAIEQWISERRIRRNVRVLQCPDLSSALTYGVLRPVILLPSIEDTDAQHLQIILCHELEHIRHFDVLWKWISTLTLCLIWYNPMVWVMHILFTRDIELHCDECVLKKLGGTKKSRTGYAMALLDLAAQKSSALPLSSQFSRNATKERIQSIMHSGPTSALSVWTAMLGIAVLTFLSFVSFVMESVAAYTLPLN